MTTLSSSWPTCADTPFASVRRSNPGSSPSRFSIAPRFSPLSCRFFVFSPSPALSTVACAIPPAPNDEPSVRRSPASPLRHDAFPFPPPSFPTTPSSTPLRPKTILAAVPSILPVCPCHAVLSSPPQNAAVPPRHPAGFPVRPATDPRATRPGAVPPFSNTPDNYSTQILGAAVEAAEGERAPD